MSRLLFLQGAFLFTAGIDETIYLDRIDVFGYYGHPGP